MKKMKRLVALIVCIATLASLCTFSVSVSAEETTLPEIVVTEADLLLIEKLEAMDMITNEYDPQSYVTRRQMADIITKYMQLTISGSDATSPFRDIKESDPSFASIVTLYDMGIITGDDQAKFNPDNYVTYDEALVFIINAIGHKMFAVREGGYPTGYHRVAIKHDMLKGLAMQKGSDPVCLTDIYKMLDAGSNAASVIPQYYGDGDVTYTLSDTDTFLSDYYDIKKYRGVVTGNEYTKLTVADSSLSTEQIEIDGVVFDTPGYYYDYFLGYTVDYYLKHNTKDSTTEMIYIEETPKNNDTISIDSEDIIMGKVTGSRIYYYDEAYDEDYISLDSSYLDVIYNNQAFSAYTDLASALPQNEMGYITALDRNSDGNYDVLFVYEYENIVVGSVDTYNESVYDEITSSNIELDSSKHDVVIRNVGESKKQTIDAIEEGNVLSIVKSKGTEKVIFVYISKEVVNGKIAGYSSDLGWLINDEYYEVAHSSNAGLELGLAGYFYLDMNGKIVTYEYDSTTQTGQYAVVADMEKSDSTLNPTITLKLFTANDDFSYIELADTVKIDNTKYDITKANESATVIKKIANNGGSDVLYNAYVIMYKVNSVGEITEIDTGAAVGEGDVIPGKLNITVDNYKSMLIRSGGMLWMWSECGSNSTGTSVTRTGTQKYARFNSTDGLVFYTPSAGDLNNEDMYSVSRSIQHDNFYDNSTATKYDYIDNFTVYSTGGQDKYYADIILVRGKTPDTVDNTSSSLAIVTAVSDAVNEDGEAVKKIYYNDGESATVEKIIEYTIKTENSGQTTEVNANTVIGAGKTVRPGTVIQFSTTVTGEINGISVVSTYNEETKVFTPMFTDPAQSGATDPNSEWLYQDKIWTYDTNLVTGTVLSNNTETNVVIFTAPTVYPVGSTVYPDGATADAEYIFTTTNAKATYRIYRNEHEGVKTITYKDLKPGDRFVARLSSYYAVRDLIVFR